MASGQQQYPVFSAFINTLSKSMTCRLLAVLNSFFEINDSTSEDLFLVIVVS